MLSSFPYAPHFRSSRDAHLGALDQRRAEGALAYEGSLTASLKAAYEGNETGSQDDEAVKALCGAAVEDCNVRMEVVHYFLTRRYKL